MGAVLTADDKGTLTPPDGQSLPTFDKRPDNASVQGSDGTTIPLTPPTRPRSIPTSA
ncbi:MAG: hypothetical protein ACLS6O_00020 [Bifidobacterium sp.]